MGEPLYTEYNLLVLRLGEIWLKRGNRREFLRRLRKNLKSNLKAELKHCHVQAAHGRLFVDVNDPSEVMRAIEICANTPGITSVSPISRVSTDLDIIHAEASRLVAAEWAGATGTFSVSAKRTFKRFPLSSPELNREVGGPIKEQTGLDVNLSAPDRTLGIEVNERSTNLWVRSWRGPGGLPVGSAGRVMLLLSGGIDSPVAGYLAQKRGCELEATYFHSPPFIAEAALDKVKALAAQLAPRQGGLKLHVAHFTEIQKAIKANCDSKMTVLLYRRFMYRIATRIAHRRRALALCTGENLGQVASQTLENLTVVDQYTPMLTLRPLMTYDKREIMDLARKIGTYDISIQPADDCCTLFVPKNPTLKGKVEALEEQEARLEVETLIEEALERTETLRI